MYNEPQTDEKTPHNLDLAIANQVIEEFVQQSPK